jgi:hypothetical protein
MTAWSHGESCSEAKRDALVRDRLDSGAGRAEDVVGRLIAIIVLPLLFTLVAVYTVVKVAVLLCALRSRR